MLEQNEMNMSDFDAVLVSRTEYESLRERLAEVDKTLRPLVDDDNRPVEALARHAVERLAEAEALLRGVREWLGPSITTWPQRIDAFLGETAP